MAMLAALLMALYRGQNEWHLLPPIVWFHIITIGGALALTPVMLLRRKGTAWHRRLGYVWVVLMVTTAIASFGLGTYTGNTFSPIHILSVLTLIVCTKLVLGARKHNVRGHMNEVRGIVIGALLIAGIFPFPFDRLLGRWISGAAALAG